MGNVWNFLQDNGSWIAAFAVVVATIALVFLNWRLIRQNQTLMRRGPVITLVARVINPLLSRSRDVLKYVDPKEFHWRDFSRRSDDDRIQDNDPIFIAEHLSETERYRVPQHNSPLTILYGISGDFSRLHWEDFREENTTLTERIAKYDKSCHGFADHLQKFGKEIILNLQSQETSEISDSSPLVQSLLAELIFFSLLTNDQSFVNRIIARIENNQKERPTVPIWSEHSASLMESMKATPNVARLTQLINESIANITVELESIESELDKKKRKYMRKFYISEDEVGLVAPGVM